MPVPSTVDFVASFNEKPAAPTPAPIENNPVSSNGAVPASNGHNPAEPVSAPVVPPISEQNGSPAPPKEKMVETPTPPSTPPIDISKILSEASGGRISTAEELSKFLITHDDYEKKIQNIPQFDDYTIKLDSWVKKGYDPELFSLVHDLPITEMSDEEVVKASLKLQNPQWSEDDLNAFVKDTYGLIKEDEDGYDANKVRVANLRLQQDARQRYDDLQKLQEMTQFADADDKEAHQMETERQNQWKTNLPGVGKAVEKITFQTDEKGNFDFVPTIQQKQEALSAVLNAVLNAPVAYDDNGIKAINTLVRNELITRNINDIVRSVYAQAKSAVTEAAIRSAHNPSGAPAAPVSPTVQDPDDAILLAIDQVLTGRK